MNCTAFGKKWEPTKRLGFTDFGMHFRRELAALLSRPIRVGRVVPVAGNLLDRIPPLVGALSNSTEKGFLSPARSRLDDPENKPFLHVVPDAVHIKAPFAGVELLVTHFARA